MGYPDVLAIESEATLDHFLSHINYPEWGAIEAQLGHSVVPRVAHPDVLSTEYQRDGVAPNSKEGDTSPIFHLTACISSAAPSRVMGIAHLSAPEWRQTGRTPVP